MCVIFTILGMVAVAAIIGAAVADRASRWRENDQ